MARASPSWPKFIGSDIFRRSRFGGKHPLSIPRVSLVMDLSRALGWLTEASYVESPMATPAQLGRYHDPAYVEAVLQCERSGAATESDRLLHHIGVNGNPVYGEIFSRPATAVGGGLLAARLLRDGGIVYNPPGGTHHARKGRAAGFCYFNEPVLTALAFLDLGLDRSPMSISTRIIAMAWKRRSPEIRVC